MASEILLLLLLAVTITTCTSSDMMCTNLGNLPVQNNKRLLHHTFLSLPMTGVMPCAVACANRGRCKSFNFLLSFTTCELNQASYAETGTITDETSWVYFDIEGFPQSTRQQCRDVNCGYNGTCAISSSLQPYCQTCSIAADCGVCYSRSDVSGRRYRSYGCFKSTPIRVLPDLHVNLRDSIIWSNLTKIVTACASASASTNREFFGIQFYGECYIGNATEANFLTPVTIDECGPVCLGSVADDTSTQVYQWIS